MTNQEIKDTGLLIKNEQQIGGNTALRVGGVIEGIGYALDYKDAANGYYQATINGGSISVNAPNYVLGTSGNLRIKMPAAGTTASTLSIGNASNVQLWYNGAAVSAQNTWEQDEIISVFYDGTRFMASNSQGGGGAADKISYDNSQSGLAATNVQAALNELSNTDASFMDIISGKDETSTTWIKGTISTSNGGNVSASNRIRSGFISALNKTLHFDCEQGYYVERIYAYNSATLGSFNSVIYTHTNKERKVELAISNNYIRVVLAKTDNSNMATSDGSNVSIYTRDMPEESIMESINEQEEKINVLDEMIIGSEEVAITLHKGGYWKNTTHAFTPAEGYSYSDPLLVYEGQKIKVTVNVGTAAYGVWGSPTKDGATGTALVGANTSVTDSVITIPAGVKYIFISSRNEDFSPAFNCSAYTTKGWIDDKIQEEIGNMEVSNPFKGLKLVALGDSITQGQSMDRPVPQYPFPVLVARELGMEVVNYGIGGSTIGTCTNYGGTFASIEDFNAATKDTTKYYVVMTGNQTYTDYSYNGSEWVTTSVAMRTPLVDRYNLMDNDADIILVAGGTNDFQYNWAEIGDVSDNVSTTFRGALNNLCSGLIAKYPQKCIVFLTPIKRCQTQQAAAANCDTTAHRGGIYGTIDSQNSFGKTLKEYGDIIKEMCARYSIPVIDMYAECMLNPQLSSQSFLFDSYKTHPFQEGHNMMARLIVAKLRSIFGMDI